MSDHLIRLIDRVQPLSHCKVCLIINSDFHSIDGYWRRFSNGDFVDVSQRDLFLRHRVSAAVLASDI